MLRGSVVGGVSVSLKIDVGCMAELGEFNLETPISQ